MASASTSRPNSSSCSHLWIYKENHGISGYKSLKIPIKRSKFCSFCSKNLNKLYFCLICSKIYCSDHFMVHIESNHSHEVGLDVERLELYCFKCQDQIYDTEFDKVVEMKKKSRCKKRKIVDKRTEMGLRGLNNLGNTCFMNSILQALVHIPQFKEHFLGHKDVCKLRRRRRKAVEVKGELSCLACDLDGVFTAIFSGDQNPYSPAEFLYRWWQHSPILAGYKQQDAHEFFISLLDKIHENEKPYKFSKAIGDCLCIAHKVFTGILKSDVTCIKCGFTSSTYDPCIDISLDFEPIIETTTAPTLTSCLDHFTRPEKLGSDQKLYCQNCQLNQDSVKQMSIQKPPIVLCLQIKRFEHSMIHETSKKINQYLKFPFTLHLKQYMSSSIGRRKTGSMLIAPEGDKLENGNDMSAEYELISFVSHIGQMNSGHYVTYIRLRGEWYLCNDAWITKVDEKVVKDSQVYMMYYMQKVLYCKTGL